MAEILFRAKAGTTLPDPLQTGHPGLLFERFPQLLSRRGEHYQIAPKARSKWLRDFQRLRFKESNKEMVRLLLRHHARMDAVLAAFGGEKRMFDTVGRLAIGLGNPSAGDIGFSLDHATGMPVIPGSSVKGLALAGARLLGEERAARRPLGAGPEPGQPDTASSGVIAFLDALPVPNTRNGPFEIDIITRHHDPEALTRQKTPLDADEPNPVHFLVVRSEVRFIFRLLPLADATSANLADAWRWLSAAVADLGAGGKTAVGYGEMQPVEESEATPDRTGGGDDQKTPLNRARDLAGRIKKENAGNLVPHILELIEGSPEASAIVQAVIAKLDHRWVKRRSDAGKRWAKRLLAAQSAN